MRTAYDVKRSLKRYVALALGDDWEVRTASEEGVLPRPSAVVTNTTPLDPTGSTHTVDNAQGYAIYAYPPVGEDVLDSQWQAEQVADLLWQAFRVGVGEGKPMRVPLYDYGSVPPLSPSDVRQRTDFVRVDDLSINTVQSNDDEMLFSVVAEVRLGWSRSGLLPSDGKTVQDVRVEQTNA